MRTKITRWALGAGAFVLLLAGCNRLAERAEYPASGSQANQAALYDSAPKGVAVEAVTVTGSRGEAWAQRAQAPQAQQPPQAPRAEVVVPTSMIIRNGAVTVEVDSLEIAIDRVRQLAQSLGGYLGNVSIETGRRQVRSATLEMKIPATRFDSAMTGMPSFGKVEQSTSTAEDVGEEFVDVSARMSTSKRLEARLVSLLATRTGKLEDVLAVERELARVRQEIERYEGRIRYLSSRVAISTIVATVHEKAPIIVTQPGTNVFRVAFVNMWRNFVGLLTLSIEVAGVLLPIALVAWGAFVGWKRWKRPGLTSEQTA